MLKNQTDIDHIRHSLAHLLAMAVLKKFPKAKLGIGPTIEDGFYYDFELPKPIRPEDLKTFEKDMRDFIAKELSFTGKKTTAPTAKKMLALQPFKQELIKDFVKEKKQLTLYTTGDFTDLCKGGHVKNTKEIDPNAFALTKIAGAYWKGDEKNPQLTRIYGVAFHTKQELDEHLTMQAEAEKRDHKKLGPQLDLFTFSELVGPGLPLWTPKGTLVRNLLDDRVWQLRKKHGYGQVDIPHITKKELYEKSGHWNKFKNELFRVITREGHEFAMKPMNCPHHIQIYARRQWSYRELPQRYANTTKVYRDEQTGELAGLSRVRAITQDDAHVFCRMDQAKEEFTKVWDIIHDFYGAFGFVLRVRLSRHDPKNPKNYLGDKKIWNTAEATLKEIIKEKKVNAEDAPGEAAFYGPKLDFLAKDSLNREWQVATIQFDMNMPEQFDLTCINEQGERERIVMIHAAIMGSIERFLAVLIEHTAGVFPFWLAPVQATILTVNDKVLPYAEKIKQKLEEKDIRVSLDARNESIGKKIREAELEKTPFSIIIGEKEKQAEKISVRAHGKKDLGEMTLSVFLGQAQ
ncbi:MAG: threonine--tRNA ligase [Candidatus Niyogibacteria bacterium CG10_big_fil_rev_8_21_14_0_10_46_36]|uniref:Threonine--tRNA ligase n=1 Tax=Candidatus Niyogibacteria bacterium CG10_big_fil_rev_8_21_14_0_10_46_36 TaxID=1974726 RepID=A0A2H0TD22_9BACT|nr:MAG: threonine--tRNA ligase [Candidatus Niyogibacteria bacterium CG10_big_fil_rev_8_21_14_0_10_46_36]